MASQGAVRGNLGRSGWHAQKLRLANFLVQAHHKYWITNTALVEFDGVPQLPSTNIYRNKDDDQWNKK